MLREVVAVTECEVRRIQTSGEADLDRLNDIVEFFIFFNDGLHDPKEEDLLFCYCHKHGMDCSDEPMATILAEHVACREHVSALRASLRSLREGTGETPSGFAERLHAYTTLVRDHMELEEGEFFDLAERHLTAEQSRELSDEFDSVRYEELNEGVAGYLESVGHTLARG
jgi:hemerythrin-like domain-containing protein